MDSFANLIEFSIALAALPGGLILLDLSEQKMWQIEGIAAASYLLIFLFSVLMRRSRELTIEDREQIPRKAITMIFIIYFTHIALMILSLFGLISLEVKALSYFGIILLLLGSVFAFVRMIFYRPVDTN